MTNILNIGIIGCGKHADNFHIPSFLRLKNKYRIIGFYDLNINRANYLKKKYKVGNVYSSLDSLLKDKLIDVVDICSPPTFHYNQIVKSLKNNKHVMVEKPMVLKSIELKKIINLNLKHKKKILCLQQQNLRDETKILLSFFRKNKKKLGKLILIDGKANVKIPKQIGNSFTNKKISGGGPLIDQGSHILGLITNILKYPKIRKMKSLIFKKKKIKKKNFIFNIEHAAHLNILFKNNINFLFETSYCYQKKINEFLINFYFKKGFINWPKLEYKFINSKKIKKINYKLPLKLASDNQFNHFYEIIKYNKKPVTSLINSLYLVRLIETCYSRSKIITDENKSL